MNCHQRLRHMIQTALIITISTIVGIILSPLATILLISCWLHSWITCWMLTPLGLEKMQGMDACFAHFSEMVVMKKIILSGLPEINVIRSKFQDALQSRDESGNLRYKKLSQIMEKHYGLWYWKTVTSVNLDDHIHMYNGYAPSNESELKHILAALQVFPMRFDIPQWHVVLIPLQGNFLEYGMSSVIAIRFHHTVADGFTINRFITSQIADDHIDYQPTNILGNREKLSRLHQILMNVFALCIVFRMWVIGRITERNLFHGQKLNNEDYVTWGVFNLDVLKDIKNATKTTLNDLLLSSLSGAIRKHFIAKNSKIPENISCLVPMGRYKPNTDYKLENRILIVRLCLPIKIEDPVERLKATKCASDELKSSPDIYLHQLIVKFVLPHIPRTFMDFFIVHTKSVTIGTSSVSGPGVCRMFDQDIILSELFQPHHQLLGINIVFHGQMDKLCVALNADTAIVKSQEDLDTFFNYLTEELEDLHKKVLKGPTPKIHIPYSQLNNKCPITIITQK